MSRTQWMKRDPLDESDCRRCAALETALAEAAQSLRAIDYLAGTDEAMEGMGDVRGYAANCANVALLALARHRSAL